MMTQPIRTFEDLRSETAPAGGNASKLNFTFDERRLLELRARYARAEILANAIGDIVLWLRRQGGKVIDAVRTDLRLRAAEAQLHRMTDRELADMGLCRGDIQFAVREAVQGVSPATVESDLGVAAAANQNLRRAA